MLTHANLTDKLEDMSERELLEYALNTVHDQSVVVYLTHHYNHEVVTAFTGTRFSSRINRSPRKRESTRW